MKRTLLIVPQTGALDRMHAVAIPSCTRQQAGRGYINFAYSASGQVEDLCHGFPLKPLIVGDRRIIALLLQRSDVFRKRLNHHESRSPELI